MSHSVSSRFTSLATTGLAFLSISAALIGCSHHNHAHVQRTSSGIVGADEQKKATPDDALAELMSGNKRFVSGNSLNYNYPKQIKATSKGQHPYAVVLACIDSRTPPEVVFDTALGDIFAPRIAGNFENTDILGSMEFATAAAGAKLILVVGHTECGAVKGAVDDVKLGNLTGLLGEIRPAVDQAASAANLSGDKVTSKNKSLVQSTADANVRRTVADIRSRSEVIAKLESEGKLKIVGAMQDLSTGKVTLLD